MAVQSQKCPNCSAELTFRPDAGDFACAYCGSVFLKQQLEEQASISQKPQDAQQAKPPNQTKADTDGPELVGYSCPSCGAEVLTDDTTAATFCYYCHNPVTITGRVSGRFKPDRIVPFAFGKEEANNRFLSWCKKKFFLDRGFFSFSQQEKMSGIYFPYWLVDSEKNVWAKASAKKIRIWRMGDTEYTETSFYTITRGGKIVFEQYNVGALQREEAHLLASILPFDYKKTEAFSPLYFAGFFAEKRNLGKEDLTQKAEEDFGKFSDLLLRDTVVGYTGVQSEQFRIEEQKSDWRYLLLPAWILTYRYKNKLYFFAQNGQTGKIAGALPVDKRKVALVSAGVSTLVFLLGLLGGYLL